MRTDTAVRPPAQKPFWVFYTYTGKNAHGERVWHKVTKTVSLQQRFQPSSHTTRCGKKFKEDEGTSMSSGWTLPKAIRRSAPKTLKVNERLCKVCSGV